ncbi:uncharacterized protein L199_003727 [Kwoniella botswanensis]|uniref:uncharacterized protein n=1 Tax=Kwoniella botswanensis TaxID=1268659 RepID=UPI00315C4EBA
MPSPAEKMPMSDSGPGVGTQLHDHQKVGLSKMLFMENDYRSLYEAMVRHDPSIKNRRFLDLSSFPHMWTNEGGDQWSNHFSQTLGKEVPRPLQGKGMILADEMGTGKSLIVLALIEASVGAIDEWMSVSAILSEEPTYRLPKEYPMSKIFIDDAPSDNPILPSGKGCFWREPEEIDSNYQTTSATCQKSRATLLVCPKSIIGVWEELIEYHWKGRNGRWWTSAEVLRPQDRPLIVYNHYEKQREEKIDKLKNASIVITTYDALTLSHRKKGLLHKLLFYRVVLDEGHHICNSKTQRFKAVEALRKRHIHVLTGTPVQNHLSELYAYAKLFNLPSGLTSQSFFEGNITSPALLQNTIAIREFGQIFSLRRLKKDLGDVDLPSKTIKVFWLSKKMPLEALEGVEDRSLVPWTSSTTRAEDDIESRAEWLTTFRTRRKHWWAKKYRPITAKESIKMKWFRFFLENQAHGKIVVFHHWKHTAKMADNILKEMQYGIVYLKANMSIEDRVKYTEKFNKDSKPKLCLLASIKVGGEGLSMVGASACVFLDLMWNPAWHAQAMDRLHRQGQINPVTVYMPMTRATYEEEIWLRQDAKRGFLNLIYPNDPPGKLRLCDYPPELLQWLRDNPDPQEEGNEDDEAEDMDMMGGAEA